MKMSDRINQAFSSGKSDGRIKGKVLSRGTDGIYIIETAAGTRLRAEADQIYAEGVWVTVLQGRILGRTGRGFGEKIFDV